VVDVPGDLLGAALGRGVLDTNEPCAPALGRDPQHVLGHVRDRATRTLLPRSVGHRVHDDLTDDSPARMAGLAAADEEPRQRVGDDGTVGLGPVGVEMAQCLADAAAGGDGPGQLQCGPLTSAP
jgi:hypothetical protein